MGLGDSISALDATAGEDTMVGRRSSSGVVLGTMATPRKVEELHKEVGYLAKKERNRRQRQVAGEIDSLLSEQSLAEWPSFSEDVFGADGAVVNDLYSKLTHSTLFTTFIWGCQDSWKRAWLSSRLRTRIMATRKGSFRNKKRAQ